MRVGTQSWDKSELASVAGQNYRLCKAGAYQDSHGRLHDLRIPRSFRNGTIVVPPNGQGTPPATPPNSVTRLCVVRMDTASAVRALAERGIEAACLNFANQYHTGGGYLSGARAQEEDLCRLMPQLYSQLSKLPYPIRDDVAHWTRTWLARTSGESMPVRVPLRVRPLRVPLWRASENAPVPLCPCAPVPLCPCASVPLIL
jgi:hypothetical protein